MSISHENRLKNLKFGDLVSKDDLNAIKWAFKEIQMYMDAIQDRNDTCNRLNRDIEASRNKIAELQTALNAKSNEVRNRQWVINSLRQTVNALLDRIENL